MVSFVEERSGLAWSADTQDHIWNPLMLAAALYHDAQRNIRWDLLLVGVVLPGDSTLGRGTSSMSCAEASCLVTGRPDQAFLLYAWARLFRDARKGRSRDDRASVLAWLQKMDCRNKLLDYKARHGVTPCPKTLIRCMKS